MLAVALVFASCHGPGGPATRAGRAVDNAVSNVGEGVEHTGEAIENAAN
jgi:predicted small secreted protein